MKHRFERSGPGSPRLFKHDFLERLSSVHFAVPLFIYVRIIYFFSEQAFLQMGLTIPVFAGFSAAGVLIWMLTAYVWHQTVSHFKNTSAIIRGMHTLLQGLHYQAPEDGNRVMISPFVSIPLAIGAYYLFAMVLPDDYLYAFYPGFLAGYLVYDLGHYALHQLDIKHPRWVLLRKKHFRHAHAATCSEDDINNYFQHGHFRPDYSKH